MPAVDFSALRSQTCGEVFTPETPGFAEASLGFNLAEPHRPDAVVQVVDAADVAAVVRFAAQRGLPVRVQATGHVIGTPMSGGVLVSTVRMRDVDIDVEHRAARVGAGVRWEEVIAAASPHGLACLCGSSPDVGVIGYTLGGGMGPMARTFGFNADRVHRIHMVDAKGLVLEIDRQNQPELFWALRGGKPDVGIVTEIEFGLMDLDTYYGGAIYFPGDQASAVMHAFASWAPGLPESVSTSIALLWLPDLPEVPDPLRGRLSVHLRFVHIGSPERGAELLAPMRAVTSPLIDQVDVHPVQAIATVHQDPTEPMPARDEGLLLRELPAQAIDALLAVCGPNTEVPLVMVEVRLMGGALARGGGDSAVGGRDGQFSVFVVGPYPPPLRAAVDASSAAVLDALRPWSTGGALINFQGFATRPHQVRAAWPAEVRARLDDIKRTWDPDGVFRFAYPV